jgi:uncharacterized protein
MDNETRNALRMRQTKRMQDIWGWVLGAIGTASSVAGIWYFIVDMHSRRRFGWKHVEKLLKQMIRDIDRSKFEPDLVIGIGRGGAIVAGMLAGNLGNIPLYVIDTFMAKQNGIKKAHLRNTEGVPDIQDRSVLLVVGELYSGEDLKEGIEFVERQGVKELRTASMLTHPTTSVQPDFYGLETNVPLIAPWRISAKYREARI